MGEENKNEDRNSGSESTIILNNFMIAPFRLERYFLNHWFLLLILIPYLTLVVLGLIYSLLDRTFPQLDLRWTAGIFTDPLFFIILCVFAFSGPSYISWTKRIPGAFQQFLDKNHLESNQEGRSVASDYKAFTDKYQQYLLSSWRYTTIGTVLIFVFIFIILVNPYKHYFASTGRLELDIFAFMHITVMYIYFPVVSVYFVGVAFWTLIATGQYINKLTQNFNLKIQPSHPDKCGGLSFLGEFSFRMALPLLMTIVSLSTLAIFIIVFWVSNNESNTMVALLFLSSPLVLLMAYLVFLGPIWRIHLNMLESRNRNWDEFAARIEYVKERLRSYLDSGKIDDAERAKKELEILDAIHPEKNTYPIWPFDTQILIKFLTPQIVPLVSFVVSSIQDGKGSVLSNILHTLFGQK